MPHTVGHRTDEVDVFGVDVAGRVHIPIDGKPTFPTTKHPLPTKLVVDPSTRVARLRRPAFVDEDYLHTNTILVRPTTTTATTFINNKHLPRRQRGLL
jgi:hypothetical protein